MGDGQSLTGVVRAEIVEVRFAFSGRVSSLHVHPGDLVKPGTILAQLDKKILQTELDKELADYERTRADFEIFVKKMGEPKDDLSKYEKVQKQSLLNASVKSVELCKYRLDESTLSSPLRGIIMATQGLHPGLYITPGANPIRIIDLDTLEFAAQVTWKEVNSLRPGTGYLLIVEGYAESIPAVLKPFLPPENPKDKPELCFSFSSQNLIYPGLPGTISWSNPA